MNKQQLANKIWESANKMRSKIEANEYKDYILGFIFYKYLSEQEVKFLQANGMSKEEISQLSEDDSEIVTYIQENIGYFISYENLFSTWISKKQDFNISNVHDALSSFSRLIYNPHKKVFEDIFDTLDTGLKNLGSSTTAQTKAVRDLIYLINDIPMGKKQDYDVLGFIYEYLIEKFAANAGKKAGEFYTPHEVSLLMSEIIAYHLRDSSEIKIYDPTSGSGSLLINIGHSISKYLNDKNKIEYYAQELKKNTYNLTRMNLVMRDININNINVRNADTLAEDWPLEQENSFDPLYVDAVVSNPPYSQNWDNTNKEQDPRYTNFGLAPKSKADYAFLLHDLFHLKPNGIMAIVLPHGVLFRGNEEGEIRKNLIENNHIDTIIGLPANIFFGTGIPTIIMILKQNRTNDDILFIDASKGFIKEGKNNKLRACDIKKIVDTFIQRQSIDKYSKLVNRDEIRENGYNLNIPRYIDSFDKTPSYDIYATMFGGMPLSEVDELQDFWQAFPNLKMDLFKEKNSAYVDLNVLDIKTAIKSHQDIQNFIQNFNQSFASFRDYLKTQLIENLSTLVISQEEDILSENIFYRLKNIALIDKYMAYQLLDDEWQKIANDLEILQTEGKDSAKKVDPNMIIKKKNSKEEEVQEGYIGHIFPFKLVQKTLLYDKYISLKKLEERLAQIPAEYDELIDNLTEEQKDSEALNDKGDKFVKNGITKLIKELKIDTSEEATEFKQSLNKALALLNEETVLKKAIKTTGAKLNELTKGKIENLSDAEVDLLLEKKWIDSLIQNLNKLPNTIVDILIKQVQDLYDKYKITYIDTENEIKETEILLSSMIDELEGNEYDMKGLNEFKSLLMSDK